MSRASEGPPRPGSPDEPATRALFVVDVGGSAFGFWCEDVVEVLPVVEVEAVSNLPPGVLGVIQARGQLLPALDLRVRLATPGPNDAPFECFVVVATEQGPVALGVTGARDVSAVNPEDIVYPGGHTSSSSPGVVRVGGETVRILRSEDIEVAAG